MNTDHGAGSVTFEHIIPNIEKIGQSCHCGKFIYSKVTVLHQFASRFGNEFRLDLTRWQEHSDLENFIQWYRYQGMG